jgi:hypothetical protein
VSPPPDVDPSDPSQNGATRFAECRRMLGEATKSPVTTPEQAGLVLALAGDVLRRTQALGDASREVLEALDKVQPDAIAAWVAALDPAAERTKLQRGMDEAFEAMLEEEADERALFEQSAEVALFGRDSLASAQKAMQYKGVSTAALDAKLATLDARLPPKARLLVGLNKARRMHLAALDSDDRDAAWWFSARVACDFLVGLYRGEGESGVITQKHDAAHLAVCEACQRDVEASALGYAPKHIAASSLWRRQHDKATADEIAWMNDHAQQCAACKRALEASAIAEE